MLATNQGIGGCHATTVIRLVASSRRSEIVLGINPFAARSRISVPKFGCHKIVSKVERLTLIQLCMIRDFVTVSIEFNAQVR